MKNAGVASERAVGGDAAVTLSGNLANPALVILSDAMSFLALAIFAADQFAVLVRGVNFLA